MKRICLFLCLITGLTAGSNAAGTPDELVRETTNKVLSELTENRRELEQNPEELYRMVDEIVLPHFDFQRMSRFVLGRSWRDATPEQQERFVVEFKTLLVRTYAEALFQYTGQDIVFQPSRHQEGENKAVVKTSVQRDDGPPLPIEYVLMQNSDEWKVYDIKVEGLSLVTNYRSQYGRIIHTQGVDTLIEQLKEKNERLTKKQ